MEEWTCCGRTTSRTLHCGLTTEALRCVGVGVERERGREGGSERVRDEIN